MTWNPSTSSPHFWLSMYSHLARLPHQIQRPLRHRSPQNLVTILRNPDQVVFYVVLRVRTCPVLRHPHSLGPPSHPSLYWKRTE